MGNGHAVPKFKPSLLVTKKERQLHKRRCEGCPKDGKMEVSMKLSNSISTKHKTIPLEQRAEIQLETCQCPWIFTLKKLEIPEG